MPEEGEGPANFLSSDLLLALELNSIAVRTAKTPATTAYINVATRAAANTANLILQKV